MQAAVAAVRNPETLEPLADNIRMFAKFDAAETIADIVIQLIDKRK
jgi:UDP-N-acetylglucosamine:LPS N-acetylglucosamine transferase